jgi:hypothetical protein
MALSLAEAKVTRCLPRHGSERHVPLSQRHCITWIRISTRGYTIGLPGTRLITRDRIGGAYHVMHSKYCGLLFGANVRLQLSFFNAVVTSTALYAEELWGYHPRTRAEQKRITQKHCKYLRSFLRLSPSTCTSSLLHKLDQLSLHGQWFRSLHPVSQSHIMFA